MYSIKFAGVFSQTQKERSQMPKFFIEKEKIVSGEVVISGGDAAHISKVLRMTSGETLTLCDGEGTDFEAEILSATKEEVALKILGERPCPAEPSLKVTLFQGLPKQGKMDYIIEKCTELGISEIVPVACKRSVVSVKEDKQDKKLARWRKIAAESVKQCGRGVIPNVTEVMKLEEAISYAKSLSLVVACYENEEQFSLKEAFSGEKPESVGIFIGPEGGFDEQEIKLFLKENIKTVTLGSRILRTETAGHTVLSCAMYEYGEMERA